MDEVLVFIDCEIECIERINEFCDVEVDVMYVQFDFVDKMFFMDVECF